jgi:hypothetical protein
VSSSTLRITRLTASDNEALYLDARSDHDLWRSIDIDLILPRVASFRAGT